MASGDNCGGPLSETEKGSIVKAFATAATALLVVGAGALYNSASAQQVGRSSAAPHLLSLAQARAALVTSLRTGSRSALEQTGANPTVTAAPGTTATPGTTPTPVTPSPTVSPYPDPQPILQSTLDVYSRVTSAHYDYLTTGNQTGVEQLRVDAAGDATCKGPSLNAHVVGKDTKLVEAQTQTVDARFIVIKNRAFEKAKATKNKWKAIKVAQVKVFQFITIDQPLICPSSSSTSGGSGSGGNVSIKDVVNLGPSTFNGKAVWHLRATEVAIDSTGAEQDAQLDFLVSQKGYLPYVFNLTQTDPAHGVTLSQKQTLTKFGKKVTIKAPKV